jgi:hypothetical protein
MPWVGISNVGRTARRDQNGQHSDRKICCVGNGIDPQSECAHIHTVAVWQGSGSEEACGGPRGMAPIQGPGGCPVDRGGCVWRFSAKAVAIQLASTSSASSAWPTLHSVRSMVSAIVIGAAIRPDATSRQPPSSKKSKQRVLFGASDWPSPPSKPPYTD